MSLTRELIEYIMGLRRGQSHAQPGLLLPQHLHVGWLLSEQRSRNLGGAGGGWALPLLIVKIP